jgi:hypothetical protein
VACGRGFASGFNLRSAPTALPPDAEPPRRGAARRFTFIARPLKFIGQWVTEPPRNAGTGSSIWAIEWKEADAEKVQL